jgi:hypothetical protein
VRQQVRAPQVIERRHDLAVGEIAGRSEKYEDRRIRDALEAQALTQDVGDRLRAGCALALASQAQDP